MTTLTCVIIKDAGLSHFIYLAPVLFKSIITSHCDEVIFDAKYLNLCFKCFSLKLYRHVDDP